MRSKPHRRLIRSKHFLDKGKVGTPDDAPNLLVMPALVAGIHVFMPIRNEDVDGRVKPGHDEA
jgi:hypothetical protein